MVSTCGMRRLALLLLLMAIKVIIAIDDGDKEDQSVNARVKSYGAHMRERFEKSFEDKCLKYPFVHQWIHRLENPGGRYYTFVFQDDHWNNGGLGDRIGGLLTAIATSLRTNRQLLVTSSNRFDELFRPYHPEDIKKP